jgi:hypothetical protein
VGTRVLLAVGTTEVGAIVGESSKLKTILGEVFCFLFGTRTCDPFNP